MLRSVAQTVFKCVLFESFAELLALEPVRLKVLVPRTHRLD
jgi:hypothetical protein